MFSRVSQACFIKLCSAQLWSNLAFNQNLGFTLQKKKFLSHRNPAQDACYPGHICTQRLSSPSCHLSNAVVFLCTLVWGSGVASDSAAWKCSESKDSSAALTVIMWVGSLINLTYSGKEISQLFAVPENNPPVPIQSSGSGLWPEAVYWCQIHVLCCLLQYGH